MSPAFPIRPVCTLALLALGCGMGWADALAAAEPNMLREAAVVRAGPSGAGKTDAPDPGRKTAASAATCPTRTGLQ